MPFGTVMAYAFPLLAILGLAVLVWADSLETQARRKNSRNRFFSMN